MKPGIITTLSGLAVIMTTLASAQVTDVPNVPRFISFQGFATGARGQPLTGPYELTFSIYTNADGTGAALWTEVHPDVDVQQGLFNVVLGTFEALDLADFDFSPGGATNRWLEVAVGTNALRPLQPFVSVPYAFRASDALTLGQILIADRAAGIVRAEGNFDMNGRELTNASRINAGQLTIATNLVVGSNVTVGGIFSVMTNQLWVSGTNIITNWPHRSQVTNLNADMLDGYQADDFIKKREDDFTVGRLTISNNLLVRTNLTVDGEALVRSNLFVGSNLNVGGIFSVMTNQLWVSGTNMITNWPHRSLVTNLNADMLDGYQANDIIGFVVGQTGREPYSSVQAAINAALLAGFNQANPVTIQIKPGTYTENLTLQPGIHLKAEIEDALFSVRIIGTNQYVDNSAGLDDLFISGIEFQSPAVATAPIFTIRGTGFASVRLNHCVLTSVNNQPALRLDIRGTQGTRLANTEMFHCRIRNTLTDFPAGTALVELNAGSLLMDEADVSLDDLAERSFQVSGTSQLIIDNAQISGRIATAGGAANLFSLIISQSSIDTGANLPGIVHNAVNAVALEVLFISTQPGNVVTGTGNFLYNNPSYFYSAYGVAQALPATAVPIRGGDHGSLLGLADDDHTQYHNNTRGDTRYAGTGWDGATRLVNAQNHIARRDNPHEVNLTQLGLGTAGGDLTGTYPNPTIAANAVTSAKIADGTIASADIANETIVSADIANGTIVNADIADNAVTSTKIADGTIASADIADGTIVGADIADGTIASADIADETIASADIANGTIASADIADGTILSADIADETIVSADIANNTIMNADVNADANIAGRKIDPVFDRQDKKAEFTRNLGTVAWPDFWPDFEVKGLVRFFRSYGTLMPQIINPDFKIDGVTLHEGEVASKGGFWAAQVKYARYDAFRAGASVYGLGDAEHGSMTVEGNLAVGLGGPGDTGRWDNDEHGQGNIWKSGTVNFRIPHPVDTNKFLIHRAVESPLAELIYRGKTQLANGVAAVNLNTYYGLMPNTLDAIVTNLSVCVYNNADWTKVRCPVVSGVSFMIEAETTNCNDIVEWLAIGKRIGDNFSDDIEMDE